MTNVNINYENEVFKVKVEKEANHYRIYTSDSVNILQILPIFEELEKKKFEITTLDVSTGEKDSKETDFQGLRQKLYTSFGEDVREIRVLQPKNIISISNPKIPSFLVKDPFPYIKEIKKAFIESFNYAHTYEGYEEFITFFKKSLEKNFRITEDEEFPGKMLKFYKKKEFIKAVYLYNGKIEFIDSFSEAYQRLQFDNIKEALEKINKHLKLEGKKPLKLGKK